MDTFGLYSNEIVQNCFLIILIQFISNDYFLYNFIYKTNIEEKI